MHLKKIQFDKIQNGCPLAIIHRPHIAEDSYTITIKQILRFHKRMHLEKFQVDKIQNGRPLAIFHLDRPDIAGYHENRSR